MDKESYFISQFQNKHIGDDGVLVDGFIYSKDAFFEGVHYKKEWLSHYQIGTKAMMANISDALSMGAKPLYALLCVAMPKSITKAQIDELACGIKESASRYGIEIIGGDTISNTKLDLTVTIISKTSKPLFRSGLKDGDLLAYTGRLGGSLKDLKRLLNLGSIHKRSKFVDIKLRDRFVLKAGRYMRGVMDISDGLFSDIEKLHKINNLGFRFLHPIPKQVGCSGEEYELIFGFDPRHKQSILRLAKLTRTPITIFAKVVRSSYKNRCKSHHF
ncbi:MAG: thiamine-phosphate kinase [Sulfuricurvum sp.]